MKILIIGNGFDLAHDLPTKYIDFLERAKEFFEFNRGTLQDSPLGKNLSDALSKYKMYDEFCELEDNRWLKYFIGKYEKDKLKGDTWIDFELELSSVIANFEHQVITSGGVAIGREDGYLHCLLVKNDDERMQMAKAFEDNTSLIQIKNQYLSEFIEILYQELREFIRAFEIYCICFVNSKNDEYSKSNNIKPLSMEINELASRIAIQEMINESSRAQNGSAHNGLVTVEQSEKHTKSILRQSAITMLDDKKKEYRNLCKLRLEGQEIDCILSFNYTNTFDSLYGRENTKYCYLHGFAQANTDKTNIILGIDDMLDKDKAKSFFAFAKFKKYFQRISLKTGAEYRDWLRQIKKPNRSAEVYIVGHSMGATDHDVLREFFDLTTQGVRITIFYHNEDAKINLIQRTIEIIGKEALVSQVHGSNWSIRFVNQYDEANGLFYTNSQ